MTVPAPPSAPARSYRSALSTILARIHRAASRWPWAVRVAVKMRNQCNRIIGLHLTATSDFARNGEGWLMAAVAPGVRTYVEVGANVGQWSLSLLPQLQSGAAGLVFEPGRRMAAALRVNLAPYPRVTVIEAACGEVLGELTFFEGQGDGQMSGLVRPHTAAIGISDSYPVRMVRLDDEIDSRGWDVVDLLKVDAEGFDLIVLRGAEGLLAARRIKVIQFEYGSGWPHSGSTLASAIEYLSGHGYSTYLLRPAGLEPVRYDYLGDHFQYANYVALAEGVDVPGQLAGGRSH